MHGWILAFGSSMISCINSSRWLCSVRMQACLPTNMIAGRLIN